MSLSVGRLAARRALPLAQSTTRTLFCNQATAAAAAAPRTLQAAISSRAFTTSKMAQAADGSFDKPVGSVDTAHLSQLPSHVETLFAAKQQKKLTFEDIGKALGRNEVAAAAIFYGQAKPSEADVAKLSEILGVDRGSLQTSMYGMPDRGRSVPMPPREPLIYRLYEIVQNYGYAYKAVLNEKFGDGIMSAISFSTKVEKETDDKGDWVVITLRGKWLPFTRF